MRKFLFIGLIFLSLSLSACESLPRIPNLKSYKPIEGDLIISIHVPPDVAKTYYFTEALKYNPSLADRLFPSVSTIDSLGKNSGSLGLGLANVISALKDNLSPYALIGSTVQGSLGMFLDARSESRDQDRIDIFMPKDAKFQAIVIEDAKIFISKDSQADISWVKDIELKPKESIKPPVA